MKIEFNDKTFWKVMAIGVGVFLGSGTLAYIAIAHNNTKKTKNEIENENTSNKIYIELLEAEIKQIESETKKED